MEVTRVEGIDPEWDNFVWESPGGTIFHTLTFLGYHPPGRFEFLNLAVRKQGRLVCLVPGGRVDAGGHEHYRSPLGASFGGFVFGEGADLEAMVQAIGAVKIYLRDAGFAGVEVTLPPACYYESGREALGFAMTSSGFTLSSREATAVVPLKTLEPGKMAPALRRNVRKARESGVTVREGSDIGAFYEILAANLAAKGATPTHTPEELKNLLDLFPDRIRLFEARLDERMAGGCLSFICNLRVALAFYICDHPDMRPYRITECMLQSAIEWFKDQGYRYFDLGTISMDGKVNWGLAKFKSKFAAETYIREKYLLTLEV